jgi:hypothetical protein
MLTALLTVARTPIPATHATAAIMPTQLLPTPNQEDPESEGESEDDEEEEQGSSRGEDLKDGVLRPPRTGDDEAVKVPPAEKLPASPSEKPKRE